MALFRAAETVRPASQRLFADSFAEHFLRPGLRRAVWLARRPVLASFLNRYADHRLPEARTSAIARTRIIDDILGEDLEASGLRQVVILGAGFDCRAYRLAGLQRATVFEVDHPATLATKLAVLRRLLPKIPDHVRHVEIDFNRQRLPDGLAQAGFQPARPTIFLWEGVTNYLSAEAVEAVLRYVASCGPGSKIIFTYVHSGALDGSVYFEGAERLLRDVAKTDEPWTFGLAPADLTEFLSKTGLVLDRDLSANEYRSLYFGAAAQQMKGYEFYHVAAAHAGERTEPGTPGPIGSRNVYAPSYFRRRGRMRDTSRLNALPQTQRRG